MATTIETLKKPNGDHVLPRTRAKAVSMEDGTTVEAVITDINTALDAVAQNPSVLYTEQDLTEEQKAQARKNIGAVTVEDVLAALSIAEGVEY